MPVLLALLADAPIGSRFGAREIGGLIFIGVAILLIWVAFRRLLVEVDDDRKPPVEPPRPK